MLIFFVKLSTFGDWSNIKMIGLLNPNFLYSLLRKTAQFWIYFEYSQLLLVGCILPPGDGGCILLATHRSEMSVARIIYPLTPGKEVYKPEYIVKFFYQKYTLLTPCNYFCENGFLKIVQLMNIWMSLL